MPICKICNSEFEAKRASAVYCSNACKQKNYNEKKSREGKVREAKQSIKIDRLSEEISRIDKLVKAEKKTLNFDTIQKTVFLAVSATLVLFAMFVIKKEFEAYTGGMRVEQEAFERGRQAGRKEMARLIHKNAPEKTKSWLEKKIPYLKE